MAHIKQQTIRVGDQRQAIRLVRLKNDIPGVRAQYKYEIRDADTGQRIEDAGFSKREALQEFNQTVSDIERGMRSKGKDREQNDPFGGGFGGGLDIENPLDDLPDWMK